MTIRNSSQEQINNHGEAAIPKPDHSTTIVKMDAEELSHTLDEICMLAHTIDDLASDALDCEEWIAGSLIFAIQRLAGQAGACADAVNIALTGSCGYRGSVDRWLPVPVVAHSQRRRQEARSV